ncbi:uncharacterized protein LOC119336642 [Triticum dicoccoides]|uniref:uncharacterized protein LOC119336642 n=1 Tax=Triticum dicoccoides TaxID=85692 RepID=UPI001890DB16|nr:uncharacterized protein LOC119336642 [Triticum dicoccoides]
MQGAKEGGPAERRMLREGMKRQLRGRVEPSWLPERMEWWLHGFLIGGAVPSYPLLQQMQMEHTVGYPHPPRSLPSRASSWIWDAMDLQLLKVLVPQPLGPLERGGGFADDARQEGIQPESPRI